MNQEKNYKQEYFFAIQIETCIKNKGYIKMILRWLSNLNAHYAWIILFSGVGLHLISFCHKTGKTLQKIIRNKLVQCSRQLSLHEVVWNKLNNYVYVTWKQLQMYCVYVFVN